MPRPLPPSTVSKLLALGIPAQKHNLEGLRRIVPYFEGVDEVLDLQTLAEIVIYLGHNDVPAAEFGKRFREFQPQASA